MSIEVHNWGVHWGEDGVAWLHQARGGMPAFFAKNVQSPFYVRKVNSRPCNHLIAPTTPNPAREHLEIFRKLIEEDQLVRFMLPMPKDALPENPAGVALIRGDNLDDLQTRITCLSRMSSPIRTPIAWLNLIKRQEILNQLSMTNVQPLVVMGAQPDHVNDLTVIRRAAANEPRRLLVVGDHTIPWGGTEIVSTRFMAMPLNDIIALPWEALGSMALRGYMRGEWQGLWFTREPTPSNEYRTRTPQGNPDAETTSGRPNR